MKSTQRDDVLEKNVETLLGSSYDPPAIDPAAKTRIREALVARVPPAPRAETRPGRRVSAFAVGGGALAVAAAVALVVGALGDRGGAITDQLALQRHGSRLELGDGTVAVLGEGGALDALGPRHVRIAGQVYLDVAPGQGRFVVDTAHGRIDVLGTRFVVDAAANETTAAVVRGVVRLASGGAEVELHAGEQGRMQRGARPTRGPAPRLSHLVGWAREARVRAEGDAPARRSGTLYARNPQWQEQDFPLPMRSLGVDVVVENQVARVALDQTFHNPRAETLEGVYRFTTPPDAALQRLAMYVDGRLTESAVVERMAARRIYEDIVYRRRDPALAEWTGAGRVDLRIFPLVGRQDRRVIVAYTQSLPRLYDDWTLTVPLPDLDDAVEEVTMNVRIADCAGCEVHSPSHDVEVEHDGDAAVVRYRRAGERPGDSLVLTVRDPSVDARVARHRDGDDEYLLVRARPALDGAAERTHRPRRWVVLDDVSASRGALERRAQAELIDRLVDTIDEDDEVAIATFDVGVRRWNEPTRAAAIDRRALRAYLGRERGGVGATDLGVALDEATRLLAGTDPRDAYVVYLGDGVVTGGARDLASLRERVAGKATFVAFAVGDGADAPGLGVLADATGGLVVPIDPADDLDWRALDAIAVLYTPRVVGLAPRVLDADGQPIAGAVAHLRSRGLAEGDELEVVVRVPHGAAAAAVEVTGERAGAAWRHRVDLGAAKQATHAGYLPRLWAQRQVEALVLARSSVTGSEDERVARREELRKEIVALGKRHFLLSPHTSLIVLENDAMYRQYGVEKGENDGWAAYQAPATIPVVTATAAISTPDDENLAIVRSPVMPFQRYGGFVERNEWWGLDEDRSVIGNGRIGTIGRGAGSGTGAGFGHAGPGLILAAGEAADLPAAEPALLPDEEAQPVAGASGVAVTTAPVAAQTVLEVPKSEARESSRDNGVLSFVTTDTLRADDAGWAVGGSLKKAKRARRWRGGGGGSLGDTRNIGWGGQPYAMAWNYAADPRLDDLTEFVPAMFPDAIDAGVAELRAAAGSARGRIDDGARALLDAARRALVPGVYRWGDGPAIGLAADGTLRWRTTHDTGLDEIATFDGTTLRRRYDELGLVVARELGDAAPALYLAVLPFVPPDPDHLARWYAVTRKADRVIALAPASAPDAATLELVFDDEHHLIAIRTATGRDLLTIRWDRGEPIGAAAGGEAIPVARASTAAEGAPADTDGAVDIALPLRPPAYWRNRIAAMSPGTAEWRDATRQLIASLAAMQDPNGAAAALRDLEQHGGLAAGDLALASGGLRTVSDDELIELLAAAGDAGGAIGRYLSASRSYSKRPRTGAFTGITAPGPGLLSTLARHREILAHVEQGKYDGALERLRKSKGPSVLRVIAAMQIAAYSYQHARAGEAWDAVAEGEWRNVARYEAARMRYNRGDYAGAADRFADLLADFDVDALPVTVDWTARSAFQYGPRGQVGWQLAWSAYRNTILDEGDLDDVMSLLAGAMQSGETDVDRVIGRAADLAAGDPGAIAEIVAHALAMGQVDRAAPLLDAALAAEPTPELLRLAAQVAERQGRVADAADLLEKALAAESDGPVPLSQLRADMQRLLALRGRVALLATGAEREAALDAALAIADRWRDLDPDYAPLDRQIGELLLAGGRREEAWRQLSTAIERHPMEGDGWALVAEVMEKEGRLDDALGYWHQAIVIDQTNPTWRMRRAQTLYALGRTDEARQQLEEIKARKWHDRWFNVTYQVDTMLKSLR